MNTERAPGRWEKRPPRVLGIPSMTETSLDITAVHDTNTIHVTNTIHDFRAHNGWYATMTRKGRGRGRHTQYEARIHDAQGRDVRGIWIYTNLKDAKLTVEERIQQLCGE